jgi:DNA polymerase zeta
MSLGEGEFQNEAYHYRNLSTGAYRVPKYSFKTLTEWYHSPVPAHAFLLFQHLLMRTIANLDLLDKTETITKTASVNFLSRTVIQFY